MIKELKLYSTSAWLDGIMLEIDNLSKKRYEIGEVLVLNSNGVRMELEVCGVKTNYSKLLPPFVYYVKQVV